MKSKNIKKTLAILIFIIIMTITNKVNAFKPDIGWKHNDIWNNNEEEFLCKRFSPMSFSTAMQNKGITVTETSQLLLCKWKHGSIRFEPNEVKSYDKEDLGIGKFCDAHAASPEKVAVENVAKDKVEEILTIEDSYRPSTNVTTPIYLNYNGENGSYPKAEKVGVWDGNTYYSNILYTTTPEYNSTGIIKTENNNLLSYIMSSGTEFAVTGPRFGFKKGNYTGSKSDVADDQLIQDALWLARPEFNEGKEYKPKTTNAYELYNEAKAYESYYNRIVATGYENKVSTDSDRAQVIVNRDDNNADKSNFIIGPFKITYPDENPFSYIEDMYIIAKNEANNTQLTVRNFEVITASGTRTYPGSNELFYLKFNAKEAGYPTSADIKVSFAYMAETMGTYEVYTGEGKVKQIVGELILSETGENCSHTKPKQTGTDKITGKPIISDVSDPKPYKKYYLSTSEKEVGPYTAQKFAMLNTRSRTWKRYEISLTKEDIDLTMDLGGLVWEDTKGGKTTGNDNIYDPSKSINDQTDKPMSNVIVTLYNKDGTIAKLSKDSNPNNDAEEQVQNPTKTDSNGKYKFTGINSMFQYYVEFTYNSQYYEPVEYVSPNDQNNGWAKGTWKVNSNGTDVITERENINARFASIGSSPNNYQVNGQYNKTYTKQELLGNELAENGKSYIKSPTRYVIIDEFGNLLYNSKGEAIVKDYSGNEVLVSSLTGEQKTDVDSKIKYVKDCQLSSYTGKDTINAENKTVRSNDLYPIYSSFVIDDHKEKEVLTILAIRKYVDSKIPLLYENDANLYINQGYTLRRLADLALKKDIYNVNLQINDKQHIYEYDTRKASDESEITNPNGTPKGDTVWDIGVRIADAYYNAEYSRELQVSDYEYKIDDYKGKAQDLGKTQDSELKVYVTYKITVRNQSQTVRMRLDELVDYYDEDLAYVTNNEKENTYILDNSYAIISKNKYNVTRNDNSRYGNDTQTKINGYNNLYVQIENSPYLESGQTAYIYLTFIVKKDGNRNVLLDEKDWSLDGNGNIVSTAIGVGKENIAEINGYSTIYADNTTIPNVGDVSGKVAGIIDRDSNPGNLNPSDVPKDGTVTYKNFEDDTDKSPNIRLKLRTTQDENRLIDGIVWEDQRNVSNAEQKTTVANGKIDKGETGINGVTVQLVELMENGTEYIWQEVSTGQGTYEPIINKLKLVNTIKDETVGKYIFESYPTGNYIVRFIYGDTVKTVLPNTQTDITKLVGKVGQNAKSYTGQDYKSTSYQVDIPEGKSFTFRNETIYSNKDTKFNSNESGKFAYDITASDTDITVSDAKDIMKDNNNNTVNMRPNATLNSREDVENYSKLNVTNHIAEVLASQEQLQEYYKNDKEAVENLLQELMNKTAMTAETGVIDVEVEKDSKETLNQTKDNTMKYKVQNVNLGLGERPKAQLAINKEITNVKVTLADGSTLFDAKQAATNVLWKEHKKYDLSYTKEYVLDTNKYGSIENIRKKNANDSRFGLIQLSMDEELMHGATIRISYTVTVSNVGEVDYDDDMFYYTGTASNVSKVVETQANQVIDYVANNLQFDSSNEENSTWEVISKKDLIDKGLVNSKLESEIEKYNTIITTKSNSNIAKTSLQPEIYNKDKSQVSDRLVLTQLITAENNSDDLTYRNIVEIVKTSNTVGRRNQYSVVGNQNPTKEPQELDSDISETVRILPPFGNAGKYIIIATTIILAIVILSGGIIFIKKKILK